MELTRDPTAEMGMASLAETRHQLLQRSLTQRDRGAPLEQTGSKAERLRNTRSCEIIHSGLHEPLSHWKFLEPCRPEWPTAFRRYHLDHGIRVVDHDTVVCSAKDSLKQTKKGLVRTSSGTITYSHSHYMKMELDAGILAQILCGGVPAGGHAWTPKQLQFAFKENTGRTGTWTHYDVSFMAFLYAFPKTFDIFGGSGEFVKLKKPRSPTLMDHPQDAIIRLARARDTGFVQPHAEVNGPDGPKGRLKHKTVSLPELKQHRLKAVYRPHEEGSMSQSSSRVGSPSSPHRWT